MSDDDAERRDLLVTFGFRVAAAFAILFGLVFFMFWWSGAALRFGAARATGHEVPTWRVIGTIRNAVTHKPVPWAAVEDDPAGKPPFYHTDADYSGVYDLLTLAEPHRIRVSAPGYHPVLVAVGRMWFLWLPRGHEKQDLDLQPE